MTGKLIAFWIPTVLFSIGMVMGGIAGLTGNPTQIETITALGYPDYLPAMLGVLKILGVVAILIPGLPRLKEWAYAGLVFDLGGAVASHILAQEPFSASGPALVILGLVLVSYALRPQSRGGWISTASKVPVEQSAVS